MTKGLEMRQLSSFLVLNVSGGDRVSYTYDTLNDETGEIVGDNSKESFFVVDEQLRSHINAIRAYIRENKLS